MNRIQGIPFLLFLIAFSANLAAQETLNEHLQVLEPWVGKTWKGVLVNEDPDKPMVDIMHMERALNGQAVRSMHSINDGVYGGETIILWDAEKKSLVYYYFTTAGFYTTGTLKAGKNRFTSHESVTGNQQGITEVKSVSEILPDGRMHVTSQYLKNGQWVEGHEITYEEAPGAEVKFK